MTRVLGPRPLPLLGLVLLSLLFITACGGSGAPRRRYTARSHSVARGFADNHHVGTNRSSDLDDHECDVGQHRQRCWRSYAGSGRQRHRPAHDHDDLHAHGDRCRRHHNCAGDSDGAGGCSSYRDADCVADHHHDGSDRNAYVDNHECDVSQHRQWCRHSYSGGGRQRHRPADGDDDLHADGHRSLGHGNGASDRNRAAATSSYRNLNGVADQHHRRPDSNTYVDDHECDVSQHRQWHRRSYSPCREAA